MRSIPVQHKIGAGQPEASGPRWEAAAAAENDGVPGLSRVSTLSQSSEGSEQVAVRSMASGSGAGELWTPGSEAQASASANANANANASDDVVGKATAVGTRKRVVIGQQRRDRYFSVGADASVGAGLPQGGFMETIRIGSLRRKLRRAD